MTVHRSHASAFASARARMTTAILSIALLLSACAIPPTKPAGSDASSTPTTKPRDPSDVKRIEDLERQVAELQKQLNDRRRQSYEEKRRLERELKDTQERLDESQKKLEAILAIDRDLRRGNKGVE